MLNPEKVFMENNFFNEKSLTSSEEAAYSWYVENANQREEREQKKNLSYMDDFSDIIDPAYIKEDKMFVLVQRNKNSNVFKTQRAELFEKIVEIEGNESKWFGESCILSPTSEYDDRKAGVDFILEWKGAGDLPERLGIDCTVSEDVEVLMKKGNNIISGIEKKIPTHVKYFKSNILKGKKCVIVGIPKVVIALKKDSLALLCSDILNAKKDNTTENTKKHFLQMTFLMDIIKQLESQEEYVDYLLKTMGSDRVWLELKKQIRAAINKMEEICAEKESSLDDDTIQRATNEFAKNSFFGAGVLPREL